MSNKELIGEIKITPKGTGFLLREESKEDIKIEQNFLNRAFSGDKVKVFLFPKRRGEQQRGEVVEILQRKKEFFVGTLERKGRDYSFLIPDDKRVYVDFFVPHSTGQEKDGYKALIKLKSWDNPRKSPEGEVIKILGKKGKSQVEREAIILEKGLKYSFKDSFQKKKDYKEKEEMKKRRDFRDMETFTIDPETAKDFDDAISFKKISDNLFQVGIHIADVSFYIKEGDETDKEARERGFSIYMVDETVPMLPEFLSNDLCSLNPNEDKLTFSVVFNLNKEGEIKEEWIGETVIRSKKRMSYKEAQKEIDKGNEALVTLNEIAKKLRKERIKKGALDIEQEEIEFKMDKEGRVVDVFKKKIFESNHLIEEMMLLANKRIAENFFSSPFLFRVHEPPDEKAILDLKGFLAGLGYKMDLGAKISSKEINKIKEKIKGEEVEFLVNNIILRSMSKAFYSSENKKHFGLAMDRYTHFTSPIRRYADLTVHRLVKKKLKGKKMKDKKHFQRIAQEVSLRELDVLEAERDSISYKQTQYMLSRVGETREGVVSGITDWGIYIRDIKSGAEGMISLRNLKDDYYTISSDQYSLIGRSKKKKYSLGNKVKVKVIGGDLDSKTIDFKLV